MQCTDPRASSKTSQELIREEVSLTIRDTQHRLRKGIFIPCNAWQVLIMIALYGLYIIRYDESDPKLLEVTMITNVVFQLSDLISSIS